MDAEPPGSWLVDVATGAAAWSREVFLAHGLPPNGEPPEFAATLKLYTPESRRAISRAYAEALRAGLSWDLELEMLRPDGTRVRVRTCGYPERHNGRVARLRGVTVQLDDGQHQTPQAADAGVDPEVIASCEVEFAARRLVVSPALARMLAFPPERVPDSPLACIRRIHRDDRRAVLRALRDCPASGATRTIGRCRLQRCDGRYLPVRIQARLVPGQTGGRRCLRLVMTDLPAKRRARQSLIDSERQFRAIFDEAPIGIAMFGLDGRVFEVNRQLCAILDQPREAVLAGLAVWPFGQLDGKTRYPADFVAAWQRLLEGRQDRMRYEREMRRGDGRTINLQIDGASIRDERGRPEYLIVQIQDVSERRQFEEAIFNETELAHVTLGSIAEGVIRTDADGQIAYCNESACRLLQMPADTLTGRPLQEVAELYCERSGERLPGPLEDGERSTAAVKLLRTASGELRPVEETLAPLRDRDGRRIGNVWVLRDATQSRALTNQLLHQASHDPLTGLPNRRAFENELADKLRAAQNRNLSHALLYLDLDHFKLVNDSCGHAAGDRLLRELTSELRSGLRTTDMLARLGGDEFAVILESCPVSRAQVLAEDLIATVGRYRFDYNGREFRLGLSIGVATLDRRVNDLGQALAQADAACYAAKRQGRNRVCLYQPDDGGPAPGAQTLHSAAWFERLIDEGGLELHAQQIIALDGDGPPSYEALVRLREREGSLLLPPDILPSLQHFGLSERLDRAVIMAVLRRLSTLIHASSTAPFGYVSINLSLRSLCQPEFLGFVWQQLAAHRTPPERIRFEIAESPALIENRTAREFVQRLRARGYRVVLDDFGAGFVSFDYLRTLHVDGIKIDPALTRRIAADRVERAIVESIVTLGERLRFEVVAEGVEDAAALDALRQVGVRHAQGWLLHRPEPLEMALSTAQRPPAQIPLIYSSPSA